jgi:S-formylglutathione hydrolase FrmB
MALREVEGPAGPPWERALRGTLDKLVVESEVLGANPLGDPARRPLYVYRSPGAGDAPVPAVYVIQGFTGQLDMWFQRDPFEPTNIERYDAMFAAGESPPGILVFVDAWTSLGGSQFLNSPATGRYMDYLCDEVVAFVDGRYPTIADRDHRGIAGKSSGGYGAMVVPMLRPDVFGGLATHAGDALFEHCYLREFPDALRALRNEYEGSYEKFWEDFRSRPGFTKQSDYPLVNTYAMAACYSANEDGSIDLPFDLDSGLLRDDVWQRWLAWDPVRMAPRHAEALRSMRAIYIDAGTRDEFFLDLGAEAFRGELEKLGIDDVFFELFDAGHGGIEYRYPLAIRYLAERLQ